MEIVSSEIDHTILQSIDMIREWYGQLSAAQRKEIIAVCTNDYGTFVNLLKRESLEIGEAMEELLQHLHERLKDIQPDQLEKEHSRPLIEPELWSAIVNAEWQSLEFYRYAEPLRSVNQARLELIVSKVIEDFYVLQLFRSWSSRKLHLHANDEDEARMYYSVVITAVDNLYEQSLMIEDLNFFLRGELRFEEEQAATIIQCILNVKSELNQYFMRKGLQEISERLEELQGAVDELRLA